MQQRGEMTLYAALDLSVGNKAVTLVSDNDVLLVVERLFNSNTMEYTWFCSAIRQGKGGPMRFNASRWYLDDELKKYGIDFMEDKVWVPLEWIRQ